MKNKQNIILIASSIYFLPLLFSPKSSPITISPNINISSNKFIGIYKNPLPTLSGKISFSTLSESDLHKLVKPKKTPLPSDQLIQVWFDKYSNIYSVSPETLRSIAYCESHYNPNATNGIYAGMFQYSPSTWISTRNTMGTDPNPDLRFNSEESIKTSAFKISIGGIGSWSNCSR